jgi:hypothetical protein
VKGAPYHSATNGGVERFNRTIQEKIRMWMVHNLSVHWSIGGSGMSLLVTYNHQTIFFYIHVTWVLFTYVVCAWAYNTDTHRGVANAIPYQLVFGQVPQVGISFLPLAATLLDSLHAEAQYRQAASNLYPDVQDVFQRDEAHVDVQNPPIQVIGALSNPPPTSGLNFVTLQ